MSTFPKYFVKLSELYSKTPNKRDVAIQYDFEEPLPVVHVDRIQMQQVFINLIVECNRSSGRS